MIRPAYRSWESAFEVKQWFADSEFSKSLCKNQWAVDVLRASKIYESEDDFNEANEEQAPLSGCLEISCIQPDNTGHVRAVTYTAETAGILVIPEPDNANIIFEALSLCSKSKYKLLNNRLAAIAKPGVAKASVYYNGFFLDDIGTNSTAFRVINFMGERGDEWVSTKLLKDKTGCEEAPSDIHTNNFTHRRPIFKKVFETDTPQSRIRIRPNSA